PDAPTEPPPAHAHGKPATTGRRTTTSPQPYELLPVNPVAVPIPHLREPALSASLTATRGTSAELRRRSRLLTRRVTRRIQQILLALPKPKLPQRVKVKLGITGSTNTSNLLRRPARNLRPQLLNRNPKHHGHLAQSVNHLGQRLRRRVLPHDLRTYVIRRIHIPSNTPGQTERLLVSLPKRSLQLRHLRVLRPLQRGQTLPRHIRNSRSAHHRRRHLPQRGERLLHRLTRPHILAQVSLIELANPNLVLLVPEPPRIRSLLPKRLGLRLRLPTNDVTLLKRGEHASHALLEVRLINTISDTNHRLNHTERLLAVRHHLIPITDNRSHPNPMRTALNQLQIIRGRVIPLRPLL